MNPLKALASVFGYKKKVFDPLEGIDINSVGWHKLDGTGSVSTLDYYNSNQYDNSYASIKAIANAILLIEPFAVNANGKQVPSNVIDALYSPNDEMSAVDFREALAVMTAVHKKVYVRVHRKEGTEKITADTIAGFTFLENVMPIVRNGVTTYQLANGEKLTADEVIVLKNINPYALKEGYSPSDASRKWTELDDYIATYQAGFFKNGAVPAGQFVITAPTVTDFNDTVDKLQERHRGAGANNNVTYVHRPTDSLGKAQNAQIEWIPFTTDNKDLGMATLFEQANKKIDSAFGVPASIRGVNDANTYASVRVDEVVFAKYVVSPIALKIWTKFTHELNRITGGMGIAITYEYEIPQMAEEEFIKAQRKQMEASLIQSMTENGYKLEEVVDAFKLPEEYKNLKLAPSTQTTTTEKSADDIAKLIGGATALIRAGFEAESALQSVGLNSVTHTGFLPVTLKTDAVPLEEASVGSKAVKKMKPSTRREYETKVEAVVRSYTKKIVEDAVANLDDSTKAITASDVKKFVENLSTVLVPLMYLEGSAQTALGTQLILDAGIVLPTTLTFKLTDDQLAEYRKLLTKVGNSYTDTVKQSMRQILERSAEQQLSASQIKQQLRGIIDEKWRVERIANTEVGRAGTKASVYAMDNIQAETGYTITKIWEHSNSNDEPCEFCSELVGTEIGVSEVYVPEGGSLTGTGGGLLNNDFADVDGGELHPNCHCYTTYRVQAS